MSNVLIELQARGLVDCPEWLPHNVQYLTIAGSNAYGVADTSVKEKAPDFDIYGWCIPPKTMLFKHLTGYVEGFGPKPPDFHKPWQKHHVLDSEANGGRGKEWDFQVYGIVQFFELCRENNPNMLDSLYTPENCVIHCTSIGRMVRDDRSLFLSKQAWKRYRGYAADQIKKAANVLKSDEIKDIYAFEAELGIPQETSFREAKREVQKRDGQPVEAADVERLAHLTDEQARTYLSLYQSGMIKSARFDDRKRNGQDNKFLYHLLRLYDQAEQILLEGDMNLQRAKETMKAVRRGEWTIDQILEWMIEKDKALEAAYVSCKLPERPPVEPLRQLLLRCLEQHYGSLSECVAQTGWAENALREIDNILGQNRAALYS